MPSDEHRHAEIKTTKGRRDEEMRRAAEMLADAGFYDDPANNLDLAAMKAQQAKDAELAALRKRVEELEAERDEARRRCYYAADGSQYGVVLTCRNCGQQHRVSFSDYASGKYDMPWVRHEAAEAEGAE